MIRTDALNRWQCLSTALCFAPVHYRENAMTTHHSTLCHWPMAGLGLIFAVATAPVIAADGDSLPTLAPSVAFALARPDVGGLQLPALDADKALREDAQAIKGQPLRYAIQHQVAVAIHEQGKARLGSWQDVGNGLRLWRLRIAAPGALSIDVALRPLFLPHGAALYLTDASGSFVRGPYTDADNPQSGEFWTPFVPGDVAYLEVLVPAALEQQLQLRLFQVNQAYRDIATGVSPFAKSGSCNIDVACPEGDNYRDQIRAVARYSFSGGLCTGQLINNSANNNQRLFITANHCLSSQSDANSVVVYWNYQNPTCRTPGSAASGVPIPLIGNSITQTGGALLRAHYAAADTTLIELNSAIPTGVTPFWDGWDRSETAKASAVVIHQPQGEEKRISFENNPLVLDDAPVTNVPGTQHWQVSDWDLGTTELGSSGSGLLGPEKRLIGVLSGGGAACGNNGPDWFGRLGVAWEGGGTPSSRVRDWLDPLNSGATVLDGSGGCAAPTVTVNGNFGTPGIAGEIQLSANITGGVAPYTLRWDVDGDGITDRTSTQATAGAAATLPVRYPQASAVTVRLNVSDASQCPGTGALAVNILGPDVHAVAAAPVQVCGDNDAVMEPGERWQVPVTLTNTGRQGLQAAWAQFAVGAAAGGGAVPSDQFGYKLASNQTGSVCPFQGIDMSSAFNQQIIPASGDVPGFDDGVTLALAVGGGAPFRLYGQNVSQIYMSTNGYLATSAEEDGGDVGNVCGEFGSLFANNARINALFDDLVVQSDGGLKTKHFASCPRPSDAGAAGQGCTVFEWRNLSRFGDTVNANASFQTILYDQSYEIVHQYLAADPLVGGSATINIENAAKTDSLSFGCNVNGQAPAGRAVCFFEPTALPLSLTDAPISFAGGAQQPLPTLANGATAQVNVPIKIATTAACGAPLNAKYVGTVEDFSYSMHTTSILSGSVGAGANCQVNNQCAISSNPSTGKPSDGLYWNPQRGGNGIGLYNVPITNNDLALAGLWFTGRVDRLPFWYLLNGTWAKDDSRIDFILARFSQTANQFPTASALVGGGVLSHDGAGNDYVMSWNIDGHAGMDKLTRTFDNANVGPQNYTGLWYQPSESGWGILIDDHQLGGNTESWMMNFIYDLSGQPTWTLGLSNALTGDMTQNAFQVHCPWCPGLLDFTTETRVDAGSQTRSFSGPSNGVFGSSINVPPTATLWNRASLPIQLITVPFIAP